MVFVLGVGLDGWDARIQMIPTFPYEFRFAGQFDRDTQFLGGYL
jgi:hypothetical protein